MEHLTELMQIVDSQSEILTEGVYIQMCNCLKKVHDHLVNPMQDSDDEFNIEFIRPRVDEIIRDIDRVELEIVRLDQDLKVTETSLKKLKLINREREFPFQPLYVNSRKNFCFRHYVKGETGGNRGFVQLRSPLGRR